MYTRAILCLRLSRRLNKRFWSGGGRDQTRRYNLRVTSGQQSVPCCDGVRCGSFVVVVDPADPVDHRKSPFVYTGPLGFFPAPLLQKPDGMEREDRAVILDRIMNPLSSWIGKRVRDGSSLTLVLCENLVGLILSAIRTRFASNYGVGTAERTGLWLS